VRIYKAPTAKRCVLKRMVSNDNERSCNRKRTSALISAIYALISRFCKRASRYRMVFASCWCSRPQVCIANSSQKWPRHRNFSVYNRSYLLDVLFHVYLCIEPSQRGLICLTVQFKCGKFYQVEKLLNIKVQQITESLVLTAMLETLDKMIPGKITRLN